MSHSDSQPRLWMTSGRSVSAKSAKMTWRFAWTPRQEKFSKKSFRASSSRNWIEEGVGSDEDNASEWKGFRDGAYLCLGAVDMTNVNRKGRERKRQSENSQHISNIASILKKRVRMHGECMNMWHAKEIASWAQSNPIQSYQHIINLHTSKCMIILL